MFLTPEYMKKALPDNCAAVVVVILLRKKWQKDWRKRAVVLDMASPYFLNSYLHMFQSISNSKTVQLQQHYNMYNIFKA